MELNKIITGLLSKAYKMDEGKIAELLKDGEGITEDSVLAKLLELDAARVSKLKTSGDSTGKFQEGYAKAKKEERAAFEKEIKEKYNLDSDSTGLDLVGEVVTANAGEGKTKEITENDVKVHPVYQALETRMKKDLKAKDAEWQTKLTDVETKHKKEATFGTVQEKALTILNGLKPVLSQNPTVAANQKRIFAESLKGFDYNIQEDGKVVILKDGQVQTDSHGNTLDFEELVKGNATNYFDFQQNNGGGNSGNNNNDGGSGNAGYPAGITKPKNIEELSKILDDETIKLEDRLKVSEVFEEEHKPA